MTAIDINRSAPFHAAPSNASFGRFAAAFTAWKDTRATRKALSVLSDRELDDIGLTRADISTFTARR